MNSVLHREVVTGPFGTYTDAELVHHTDNLPSPTPLERELADRLDAALTEIATLKKDD